MQVIMALSQSEEKPISIMGKQLNDLRWNNKGQQDTYYLGWDHLVSMDCKIAATDNTSKPLSVELPVGRRAELAGKKFKFYNIKRMVRPAIALSSLFSCSCLPLVRLQHAAQSPLSNLN